MDNTLSAADRIGQIGSALMPPMRPKPVPTDDRGAEAVAHGADTLIVTPLSWDLIAKRHHSSMVALDKPRTGSVWIDGDTIDDMRCKGVETAKERGFRWLFFVDADMVLPVDALERLRAHNKPIVGALCRQRKTPFRATCFRLNDEGWLEWYHPQGNSGLVRVDATGAACLLIDMQVFADIDEQLPHLAGTWFLDARRIPGLKPQEKVSEDLWFCSLARAAGYEIYVDLDTSVGHLVMGEIIDDGTPEHGARFRLE